jgi:hypothetical protein
MIYQRRMHYNHPSIEMLALVSPHLGIVDQHVFDPHVILCLFYSHLCD